MAKMSGSAMLMMAIFIGAIVTVVFLAAIADQIDVGTSTYTETNGSYTFPAAGSDLVLEGKRNLSAIIMVNATGNVTPIGEDEFNQTTVDDGDAIALTITGNGGPHAGATVNVTYDYEPIGYLGTTGSRNVFSTVAIIAALAIVFFIIVMIFKGPLRELIRNF